MLILWSLPLILKSKFSGSLWSETLALVCVCVCLLWPAKRIAKLVLLLQMMSSWKEERDEKRQINLFMSIVSDQRSTKGGNCMSLNGNINKKLTINTILLSIQGFFFFHCPSVRLVFIALCTGGKQIFSLVLFR